MQRIAAVVAVAGLPVALFGQTMTRVVTVGDPVAPVGLVTLINNLAVNNSGQWIVEADTDNPDTNADEVLIKSGALHLREGQALVGLSPGTLGSFDSININSAGNSGWNFFLDGTAAPTTSTDSGIFFNDRMIFQESTISTAPQFSPNTPHIGFFEVKINDANQLLIVDSIDDPAITSTVDRAMLLVTYNPTSGAYTESVIAKEGDNLAGMAAAVADFGTTPQSFAFNNNGDAIFVVTSVGGASDAVYRNLTALAVENTPSPIAGRNWLGLQSASVHLNNTGEYVHTGQLSGDTATDLIIMKNGAKFMQEGDAPPGIGGGWTLTGFGTGNIVQIADNGKVLWFGDWNDPVGTTDTALFLDNQVLVRENTTVVDGLTVSAIVNAQDGFTMSPNGRYIIVEVTLTDGVTPRGAALLIDMGAGGCYANCDGSTGTPALTANDFQCFINKFAANDAYANCDESTGSPALTANDFQCFINKFAGGCR